MEFHELAGQALASAIYDHPERLALARAERPDWVPDLSGTAMVGWDLSGLDLHGANLAGADLTFINLTEANLAGADLRRANLCGSLLNRADLTGAQLVGTQLAASDMIGAIGVDLTGAYGIFGIAR